MTAEARDPIQRLIVSWKNDDSPVIVPVAELRAEEGPASKHYVFRYVEGVKRALALGFQPFLAFPDLESTYSSTELFEFFRNRILPTTRPDYVDSIKALGLDPHTASLVEVLGRSNAPRATDKIEVVPVPRRDETTGDYLTHFALRGVRYRPDAEPIIAGLQLGDDVTIELEPGNPYNPRARRLLVRGSHIGYLPDYLVADVDGLEERGSRVRVAVERVNPPPHPAHHRLLCRLEAKWPDGFVAFRDPKFAPYKPTGATALRAAP